MHSMIFKASAHDYNEHGDSATEILLPFPLMPPSGGFAAGAPVSMCYQQARVFAQRTGDGVDRAPLSPFEMVFSGGGDFDAIGWRPIGGGRGNAEPSYGEDT